MNPVLDVLATEYKGGSASSRSTSTTSRCSPSSFNVRSMPTFVLVRDGREVGRVVGSRPRAFVAGVLDRALSGDVAIAAPYYARGHAALELLARTVQQHRDVTGVTPSASRGFVARQLLEHAQRDDVAMRRSPSLAMQPTSCAAVSACSSASSGAGSRAASASRRHRRVAWRDRGGGAGLRAALRTIADSTRAASSGLSRSAGESSRADQRVKRVLHDIERIGGGDAFVARDRGESARVVAGEVGDPVSAAASYDICPTWRSLQSRERPPESITRYLLDAAGMLGWGPALSSR